MPGKPIDWSVPGGKHLSDEATTTETTTEGSKDFLREKVAADVAAGRWGGRA